jgi:large subunit ribosomal protein L21
MYAVIDLNGSQVKVEKDDIFTVNRIKNSDGKTIKADKVLFARKGAECLIGEPYVKDAFVECEILGEKRAKKVIAFKYRDRKSSQSRKGHRQDLSELKVTDIVLGKKSAAPAAAEKTAKTKKPAKKTSRDEKTQAKGKKRSHEKKDTSDKK